VRRKVIYLSILRSRTIGEKQAKIRRGAQQIRPQLIVYLWRAEIMATSRRVSRVSSLIKREISQMLLNEIKDDRVGAGMVSITDVNVSGDLQHAKVFVSIYGTAEAKAETMEGLRSSAAFVRRELGNRMRLRRTPEVVFLEDTSLERGDRMLNLLNQISQERQTQDTTEDLDDREDAG
jgi:ribosome-binding factor A